MLDKDVGEELLKLDLSPKADAPANQIERILDADRRYLKRWTRISITLWILAALGAMVIFVMGGMAFPMIAKLLAEKGEGTLDNPDTPLTVLAKLTAMCLVFGSASFLVLVSAGLATVLILVRSRGATLRQINSNLLLISEQLKSVLPGGAGPPSGTGMAGHEM
jgi:hypothetical protein